MAIRSSPWGGTANLTDGSRSSIVNVGFLGGGRVQQAGERFTLIDASTVMTNVLSLSPTASGLKGVSLRYDFDIAATPTALTATVREVRANPQTKAFSEGQAAGVGFINAGGDFAAGAGMASLLSGANNAASRAASKASSAASFGFGALGGSSVRTETGSHVKVNGASLLVGAGVGQSIYLGGTSSELTLGGFFETGKGNVSTYNSFGTAEVNGAGDTRYIGVGALAHLLTPSGFYTEGSARVGTVKNEFGSDLKDMTGQRASYETESTYVGLHVGVGKVIGIDALKKGDTLDVYGKYFFTHQSSDEATILGDKFSFDAVQSHRLRTGARYNLALNDAATLYTGGAYEYEFDGKANASVLGYAIDAPELKGGSGVLELGATVKPSKTTPLSVNIGIQGYVGQREGVAGQASLKYEF